MRGFVAAGAITALVTAAACGPAANDGGCKDTLIAGDLVITEVFADYGAPAGGTAADEGKEWFEIYNASDRPLELSGLTVVHDRPEGSDPKTHIMDDVTIAPGQYMTLGNSTKDLLPPYIDYGYSADLGGLFNSDGGKLELKCGSTEIDSSTYESVRAGRSRQLTSAQPPDYTLNDDQVNWCEAVDTEFESNNFGTPGQENDCSPIVIGQCSDGGTMRDSVTPEVGDLVITEMMPNPSAVGDTAGEWFEVIATRDIDLNNVGLDRAGDSSSPAVIESPDCVRLTAGSYAVFARNPDMLVNGGLPADAVRGSFGFSMIDGTAAAPGDVRVLVGMTVIDAVTWVGTRSGSSHQLDPGAFDPSANDEASNFCDGTTAYGMGDLGTPGGDNDACPLVPPAGMCDAGGTLRPIVKPAAGQLVISEFLSDPEGTDTSKEWFEITNTGATSFDLNELTLGRAGTTGTVIQSAVCLPVAAGGFGLFARSNDPAQNAMLPAVDATFGFGLVQTSGDVEVRDGLTILDAITWPSSTSGVARQLDPDSFTTTGNDDPASFCPATTPYGDNTNLGTPKAANAQCP